MDTRFLKCVDCDQQLPNQTVPLYLFTCGHLVCALHMMSPTCPHDINFSVICDVDSDSICKSLCQILDGVVKAANGVPQEYLCNVYYTSAQAIEKRLKDIIEICRLAHTPVFQPVEPVVQPPVQKWVCELCGFENEPVNPVCWKCHGREDYLSVSMPVLRPRRQEEFALFHQLITVVQKDGVWVCERCNAQNPCRQSKCGCGFVNFQLVSGMPSQDPVEEMKEIKPKETCVCPTCGAITMGVPDTCNSCRRQNNPVPVSSERNPDDLVLQKAHSFPIWRCENCTYEYNLNTAEKCLKCNKPNPLLQAIPVVQVKAAMVVSDKPAIQEKHPMNAPVKPIVKKKPSVDAPVNPKLQNLAPDVQPSLPQKRANSGVKGKIPENSEAAISSYERPVSLRAKKEQHFCPKCNMRLIVKEELCQECFESKQQEIRKNADKKNGAGPIVTRPVSSKRH